MEGYDWMTQSERQAMVMVRLFRRNANIHYTVRRTLVRQKLMSSELVMTPDGEIAANAIIKAMGLEVTVIE